MRVSKGELRQSLLSMLRGTLVGAAFGAMFGTAPATTSFISCALERRIRRPRVSALLRRSEVLELYGLRS